MSHHGQSLDWGFGAVRECARLCESVNFHVCSDKSLNYSCKDLPTSSTCIWTNQLNFYLEVWQHLCRELLLLMRQMEFIYDQFKYLHYSRPFRPSTDFISLTGQNFWALKGQILRRECGRLPPLQGFFFFFFYLLISSAGFRAMLRSFRAQIGRRTFNWEKSDCAQGQNNNNHIVLSLFLHAESVQPPWGLKQKW